MLYLLEDNEILTDQRYKLKCYQICQDITSSETRFLPFHDKDLTSALGKQTTKSMVAF